MLGEEDELRDITGSVDFLQFLGEEIYDFGGSGIFLGEFWLELLKIKCSVCAFILFLIIPLRSC